MSKPIVLCASFFIAFGSQAMPAKADCSRTLSEYALEGTVSSPTRKNDGEWEFDVKDLKETPNMGCSMTLINFNHAPPGACRVGAHFTATVPIIEFFGHPAPGYVKNISCQ